MLISIRNIPSRVFTTEFPRDENKKNNITSLGANTLTHIISQVLFIDFLLEHYSFLSGPEVNSAGSQPKGSLGAKSFNFGTLKLRDLDGFLKQQPWKSINFC